LAMAIRSHRPLLRPRGVEPRTPGWTPDYRRHRRDRTVWGMSWYFDTELAAGMERVGGIEDRHMARSMIRAVVAATRPCRSGHVAVQPEGTRQVTSFIVIGDGEGRSQHVCAISPRGRPS
jgi:hypothetical protein